MTTFLYMKPSHPPDKQALAEGIELAHGAACDLIQELAARSVSKSGDWWLWLLDNMASFPGGEYKTEPSMPSGKDYYLAYLAKRLMSWRSILSVASMVSDDEHGGLQLSTALCAFWHINMIGTAAAVLLDPEGCGLVAHGKDVGSMTLETDSGGISMEHPGKQE